MRNRIIALLCMGISIFTVSGCSSNAGTGIKQMETNVENNSMESEAVGKGEITVEETSIYEETTAEEMTEEKLTYKGGTHISADTMRDVLYDFFSITRGDSLQILEELPLTENFFNQCVEDFPYIEVDSENRDISIAFWAVDNEDTGMCLLDINIKNTSPKGKAPSYRAEFCYVIEFGIVDDMIDSMKIEKLR